MKRYLVAIAAVVCTVTMLSFTNSNANSSKFACSWFIYDNPSITDPTLDFPSTLSEATTVANYRASNATEVANLCPAVRKICAICAEVDALGKPKLGSTEVIVTDHLTPYFNQANEVLRVPNNSFIVEKFTF